MERRPKNKTRRDIFLKDPLFPIFLYFQECQALMASKNLVPKGTSGEPCLAISETISNFLTGISCWNPSKMVWKDGENQTKFLSWLHSFSPSNPLYRNFVLELAKCEQPQFLFFFFFFCQDHFLLSFLLSLLHLTGHDIWHVKCRIEAFRYLHRFQDSLLARCANNHQLASFWGRHAKITTKARQIQKQMFSFLFFFFRYTARVCRIELEKRGPMAT